MERLQKYIASCGIASRRKAEELITEGKVQVNGRKVTELGVKINPQKIRLRLMANYWPKRNQYIIC